MKRKTLRDFWANSTKERKTGELSELLKETIKSLTLMWFYAQFLSVLQPSVDSEPADIICLHSSLALTSKNLF